MKSDWLLNIYRAENDRLDTGRAESHSRYSINGEVEFFAGTYEEYINREQPLEIQKMEAVTKEKNKNNEYFANKERNKKKMRLNKVEREIEEKEKIINQIQEEMAKEEVYSDYMKLTKYQEQLALVNKELEVLMIEWEELSVELG